MTRIPIRAAIWGTALSLSALAPSFAQTPSAPARPATSIIVFDVDRIVSDSAAYKSAAAQLRPQRDQLQTRVKTLQESFQREQQALQAAAQGKTLTQEVLETRARDLNQREQTAQAEIAGKQQTLEANNRYVISQIAEGVTPIVSALMRERGAQLAMPRSQFMQTIAGIDITADVLSRLDQRLPHVSTVAPAQPTTRR